MANSTVCQSKSKPVVEPRWAKPKTYRQAITHWLMFYEVAVIESEAFIWLRAHEKFLDIPSPVGHGRKLENDNAIEYEWTSEFIVPQELVNIICEQTSRQRRSLYRSWYVRYGIRRQF